MVRVIKLPLRKRGIKGDFHCPLILSLSKDFLKSREFKRGEHKLKAKNQKSKIILSDIVAYLHFQIQLFSDRLIARSSLRGPNQP
jgi:hypothetical protein